LTRKERLESYVDKFNISLTILEFEKLFSEVEEIAPSGEELLNLSKDEEFVVQKLRKRAF
jgi:hypothetical protein